MYESLAQVLDPLMREKYKFGTEEGRQRVIAETKRTKFGNIGVEIISGEGDPRSVQASPTDSKNVSVLDHDHPPHAHTTSPGMLDNNSLL